MLPFWRFNNYTNRHGHRAHRAHRAQATDPLSKIKNMKEKKPSLKLCSNHFPMRKTNISRCRWWNSRSLGTAYRDGAGWYKTREEITNGK